MRISAWWSDVCPSVLRGEVGSGAQIECTEVRTHAGRLVPEIAGSGAPCAKTKNPRRARVSGRLWPDLLLVACPVARPRIARTIIRTAIIAVEGVAGGGTEAGHGWKLADGPDRGQDPCAPPIHAGTQTGIYPDHPQLTTDPQTATVFTERT